MEKDPTLNRFQKSWYLTKAAWQALRLDKELVTLPVIGVMVSLGVLIVAAIITVFNPGGTLYTSHVIGNTRAGHVHLLGYIGFIAVGLLLSMVGTFISGAVIHGAIERFKGNDPTIKSSLAAAWKRLGSLLAFSAFSFTIGYVLSLIANRIPFLGGKIVVWLANTAWNIASFFAVPVIVTSEEPVGPIKATKQSATTIKQVWGESLVVGATVGIIAVLSFLTYVGLVIIAFVGGNLLALPQAAFLGLGLLSLLGVVVLGLVFSVLAAFAKAAIYYYAVTGESPVQFNQQLLRQAFSPKKARKVFSS